MIVNPIAQVSRMGSDALTKMLQRVPKESSGRRVKHVVVLVFMQDLNDDTEHGESFISEMSK